MSSKLEKRPLGSLPHVGSLLRWRPSTASATRLSLGEDQTGHAGSRAARPLMSSKSPRFPDMAENSDLSTLLALAVGTLPNGPGRGSALTYQAAGQTIVSSESPLGARE